jgi:hypothetical protein
MAFRLSLLISFVLIAILFIPVKLPSTFSKPDKNEAIIHYQECGCPCPDARIIEGNFLVPDSLTGKFKRNDFSEIYLTNDSDIDFEVSQFDIRIKGTIVGANPDFCDSSGCYYTPIVRIDSWELSDYLSWFWTWNNKFGIVYLLITLISIITTIVLTAVKFFKKIKNRHA